MQRRLLVAALFAASLGITGCGTKTTNSSSTGSSTGTGVLPLPGKPTATTAYVFTTDYFASSQVLAIDVESRTVAEVLGPDVLPRDALIRAFGKRLYVVGRDFIGANNNLVALDPENNYQPACGGDIASCQLSLGDKFNARDLWAVSEHRAFLTADILADGNTPGSVSNFVHVFDPITKEKLGQIDVASGAKAAGTDLLAEVGDGTLDLEGMFSNGTHLFVIALMLETQPEIGGFIPRKLNPIGTSCGFSSSAVIAISLDTQKVDKVIRLSGANAVGGFVVEPGTDNLLIATPGATDVFTREKCGGIERINASKLTYEGMAVTELQMSNGDENGGTVFSFDVDSQGNGIAFVGAGNFDAPAYKLVRFKADQGLTGLISDPGVEGLSYFGFVSVNNRGQAYVSLPFAFPSPPGLAAYDVATGARIANSDFNLSLGAASIAFYPGLDFTR